jgi:hypothetical protein
VRHPDEILARRASKKQVAVPHPVQLVAAFEESEPRVRSVALPERIERVVVIASMFPTMMSRNRDDR